jgi:hypothetical protein
MTTKSRPDTTLELFTVQIQDYLDEARDLAETIARRKQFVTIDDVLAELPRPEYVEPRRLCHLFSGDKYERFMKIGGKTSVRGFPSNRHYIGIWQLKEDAR